MAALTQALCLPTYAAHSLQLEALRRWVLVRLIRDGALPPLDAALPLAAPALVSQLSSAAQWYVDWAGVYAQRTYGALSRARAMAAEHAAVLSEVRVPD